MATANRSERNVFSFVEEATHLLRRAPAAAWLRYYLGSAPFVVFLFFFWSDMSRSPYAANHLPESALILALLFVWMKVWQARFCAELLAHVEGREDAGHLSPRGWMRLIASQALVHSTMPWLLTLASVAVIPVAWTYAFYHNVTVLAVGHFRDGGRTKALLGKALTQAHYAPKENHCLMVLLSVFGPMVYLNILVAFVMGSQLLKSFTGVENAFTLHPMLYLSSALQALLITVSYLVVNPLAKAFYVLRCFYGEARRTGADIEVSLRSIARPAAAAAALVLIAGPVGAEQRTSNIERSTSNIEHRTINATAKETPRPAFNVQRSTFSVQCSMFHVPRSMFAVVSPPPPAIPTDELGQSIRDVLQGSEFQWRLPRDVGTSGEDDSWLGSLLRRIGEWIDSSLDAIGRFIGDLLHWIFGSGGGEETGGQAGSAWLAAMPKLVVVLVVLLVVVLIWMLWKNWKESRLTAAAQAEVVPPEINLESEQVLATQLPENEWLKLAREKMEAGELRLALRALFLATLAHLGEKRLIQVSRSKSNGDYVRELGWRARGREELSEGFTQQVRTFDRVWYGWHDVTADLVSGFEAQHEKLTTHAT